GLQHADAEDVRQLVMVSLSKAFPNFHYSPERGRFRSYLGQVVRRAVFQYQRHQRPNHPVVTLENMEAIVRDQSPPEMDAVWEQEWIGHHYRRAMRTIRATFE